MGCAFPTSFASTPMSARMPDSFSTYPSSSKDWKEWARRERG
jgi:hypothetical protein